MKNSTGWHPEADSVDCPVVTDDTGSVDGRFWDLATVDEIVAMQRLRTSIRGEDERMDLHNCMTAKAPVSGH
jgi:hypothetical protein